MDGVHGQGCPGFTRLAGWPPETVWKPSNGRDTLGAAAQPDDTRKLLVLLGLAR